MKTKHYFTILLASYKLKHAIDDKLHDEFVKLHYVDREEQEQCIQHFEFKFKFKVEVFPCLQEQWSKEIQLN